MHFYDQIARLAPMYAVSDACALAEVRATMRETTPREDHGLIDELLEAVPDLVERFYLPAIARFDQPVCRETGATRPMAYTMMADEITNNPAISSDPVIGGVSPHVRRFVGLSEEILRGKLKAGWAAEHASTAFYTAVNVVADNLLQVRP